MAELTEEQDDIGVTRWSVIMSDPATNRETGLRIYHGEDELHARSVHACVAALEAENDRLREAMKVTEADRNAARESLAQELRSVLGERGLWTPKGRASDLILAFSKAIDDLHAKLEAAETREVAILKRNREQAERLTAAEAERHRLREFVGDVKAGDLAGFAIDGQKVILRNMDLQADLAAARERIAELEAALRENEELLAKGTWTHEEAADE